MQSLPVISVNIWQMVAALGNLVLLFLIAKKFLYKPVKNMLAARRNAIDSDYNAAQQAKEQAEADKQKYEDKLQDARAEADSVIKSAVSTAAAREKEILNQAKERADGIIRQAEAQAELEHKKAEASVRKEIVEVSSVLTEKLLEREVSADDHKHFIDSFIESIGDEDGTD